MMNIPLLPKIFPRDEATKQVEVEQALIRAEAEIGGKLFGQVPEGRKRQFFCLDEHTWVWHEEWIDQTGKQRVVTTRYRIHPSSVVKSQDGQPNQRLSKSEARNLYRAIDLYGQQVDVYYQQLLAV